MDLDLSQYVASVGVYTHPEIYKTTIPYNSISLGISGYERFYSLGKDMLNTVPAFIINAKGDHVDVKFNESRENWVVVFKDQVFCKTNSNVHVEFLAGSKRIAIPRCVSVPEQQLQDWRSEFMTMRAAFASPTPGNLFRVNLGIYSMLRFMIDSNPATYIDNPAQMLKKEIDTDDRFRLSLAELSEKCGYSADHLRILFENHYQMPPGSYRSQRRLALATERLSNSYLTVKEISNQLGFEHVSAFSSFYKKHTNRTPSQAITLYRYLQKNSF